MHLVVVGCGRVGTALAVGLEARGDTVVVVDKDPRMLERLGERFTGRRVEGVGFDRDVLEAAGIARADALVAVTGGDNSNIVTARVARDAYRVPRVIARIHDPRRAEIYEQLGVTTVSSVGWTLRKVKDHLEHRLLAEEAAFGRGEVSLLRIELPQHLVDRRTADLETRGLRVVSVTRHGGAFVPAPDTVLAEGDVLRVAVGDAGRTWLDDLLAGAPPAASDGPRTPVRSSRQTLAHTSMDAAGPPAPAAGGRADQASVRVLVAGAGMWGAYIADHLVEQGNQVVVVEQDAATVRRARAAAHGRTIIHGDACEPGVLELVEPQTVDTVVAATGDDEDNLVISLLCRRLWSVPRTVARVNNPKNTWLFTRDWGVDTAVSAPALLTHLLDAGVGVLDVVTMLRTERGGIALVEVTLDEDAAAVGQRIAELPLPEGSVVVTVVRDEQVLPGGGPTPLAPGDEVLAVTTLAAEPSLRRVLGGEPGGSHIPSG